MKKIFVSFPFLLAISGCATFEPREGMTINDVSKAAYVPCDGTMSTRDMQLVRTGTHPEDQNIEIYRTRAHQEFRRAQGECAKDLYFYNGKLINESKISALIEENKPRRMEQLRIAKIANDWISKENVKLLKEQDERNARLKKEEDERAALYEKSEVRRKISELIEKEKRQETLRNREINENNNKFGTTGIGLSLSSIKRECLHSSDIFTCDLIGPNLVVNAAIRNNTTRDVKDVEVRCRHYAQSGTEITAMISKNRETIYQRWAPGEIRNFKFKISDVTQRHITKCEIVRWM